MLSVKLDQNTAIAVLMPDGALSKDDFTSASEVVDPFIEQNGKLNGIIIYARSFPGWDSFAALVTHLKFIKEHHKKVNCIAFVTDSPAAGIAQSIAGHFVEAKIKEFPFAQLKEANQWILASNKH